MAARGPSVFIIEARYYEDISAALLQGATDALDRAGASYERLAVPGALEIPVAFSIAIRAGRIGLSAPHQGCVALGCVIRGETSHYDIVANESARALMQLASAHAVPVGNGILTVDTADQARARARLDGGDKGGMAALACLALIEAARAMETSR